MTPPTNCRCWPARRSASRVPPRFILKQSLRDVAAGEPQAALARGEVLKQVGRCRLREDGSIEAEVRIEALPARPSACRRAQRGKSLPGHRRQGCEARRQRQGRRPLADRSRGVRRRDGPAAQPRRRGLGRGRRGAAAPDGVSMDMIDMASRDGARQHRQCRRRLRRPRPGVRRGARRGRRRPRGRMPGVRLGEVSGLVDSLPDTPETNTALAAAKAVLDAAGADFGVRLSIRQGRADQRRHGRIRGLGGRRRGRGQCAAAASRSTLEDLLPFALRGRARLLRSAALGQCRRQPVRRPRDRRQRGAGLRLPAAGARSASSRSCFHPAIRDRDARRPGGCSVADVPMALAVEHSRRLAAFVAGCATGDLDLLRAGLEDLLVEPQREHLLPALPAVKAAALAAGALGCSFSGSGPSVFAWALEEEAERSRRRWPRPSAAATSTPAPIARRSIRRASGSSGGASRRLRTRADEIRQHPRRLAAQSRSPRRSAAAPRRTAGSMCPPARWLSIRAGLDRATRAGAARRGPARALLRGRSARCDACRPSVRGGVRLSRAPGRSRRRRSGLRVLELFHGPTGAFKDFGARFLMACFDRLGDGERHG